MPNLPPRSPQSSLRKQRPAKPAAAPALGSSPSSASLGSRRGKRAPTETEEAELLSRATAQAMTAARSILLAGGSEATALLTARAAATSILAPTSGGSGASDPEQPGMTFLGRRKGKRQAEVVASMALLSVKQTLSLPEAATERSMLPPLSPSTHSERPPTPARSDSPVMRRSPFRPPSAERYASGATAGDSGAPWVTTTERMSSLTGRSGSGSGGRSAASSVSSVAAPVLPPIICTSTIKPIASDGEAPPPPLAPAAGPPRGRQKTRDLTGSLPNEDPIYCNEFKTPPRRRKDDIEPRDSYSSASSFDSDSDESSIDTMSRNNTMSMNQTMTCDSYDEEEEEDTGDEEAAVIARAIAERNRETKQSGADAFFASLSNIILCGMGSDVQLVEAEYAQSRDAPLDARGDGAQSRDNGIGFDVDDDADGDESTSSANSAEVLAELNKKSFDADTEDPKHQTLLIDASAMADAIRRTMAQALAFATSQESSLTSTSEVNQSSPEPTRTAATEMPLEKGIETQVITLQHQPGKISARPKNPDKPKRQLSQRVKFQSWMRRRRGADTRGAKE